MGALTLREGEEGTQRSFTNTAKVGDWQTGTTASGRRLAHSLPSHLQGRRGSGMGDSVLQVRGHQQGSQRSPPEWE